MKPEREEGGVPDFLRVSQLFVPTSKRHKSRYSIPVSLSSSTSDLCSEV